MSNIWKSYFLILDICKRHILAGGYGLNKKLNLRISANEGKLRERVKTAGGKWNHKRQVWELPYKAVLELGLTKRIVE